VDSAEPDVESELILAHAWDSMLKINFLLHLYHLDDDKNDESVANDRDDNEFVNFIERLFVWGLEEVINSEMNSTESFTDLGKLNFPRWFSFRLEPIFSTAPTASKNTA
jgi:hypothetical protein